MTGATCKYYLPVQTWNGAFDAAAKECGLEIHDLLALTGSRLLNGWRWIRLGSAIQCAKDGACWTVNMGDIRTAASMARDLEAPPMGREGR